MRLLKMRGMGAEGARTSQTIGANVTEEYRKELEKQFGFDKPIYEQYYNWLVTNCMGMNLP